MSDVSPQSGARRMFRYIIPVDGFPHAVTLTGSPVAVAEDGGTVQFWAEATEGGPQAVRIFKVYGTGHLLPPHARWAGTCARTPSGLVWHLYELEHGGNEPAGGGK